MAKKKKKKKLSEKKEKKVQEKKPKRDKKGFIRCKRCGRKTKNKVWCSTFCRNKKKLGRPPVITEKKEEELIALIADGETQNRACRVVGVSKAAMIEHKKKYPDFKNRLEKAKHKTDHLALRSIKVGMTKDWKAGAWWLERTQPKRFRETKEVEVNKPNLLVDFFEDDQQKKKK